MPDCRAHTLNPLCTAAVFNQCGPSGLAVADHFMQCPVDTASSKAVIGAAQDTLGEDSPCTNDYNGRYGKAFVRTRHAVSVWTHGGGVRGPFGEGSMFNGQDVDTERCPVPICMRADPYRLHIYHLRSPSVADAVKKDLDEGKSTPAEGQERMQQSDEDYDSETWFFNQIRDVSLAKFESQLTEQIRLLQSWPSQHGGMTL